MKHSQPILMALAVCLAGCQGNNRPAQNTSPDARPDSATETAAIPAETATCYRAVSGKDSVLLHLRTVGKAVTGELVYSFFEKDNNTGTLNGELSGDTLFAEYTFASEGQQSVREVAFLKRGNELVEGFGPVREAAGKMVFENKSGLAFTGKLSYQEAECHPDEHGCMGLMGSRWSALKQACIRPRDSAIRLNAGAEASSKAQPAFLMFSEDKQQAELFLPGTQASLLLKRQGAEGKQHWENGDWKLYPWKGYVLKQRDKVAYAGQ